MHDNFNKPDNHEAAMARADLYKLANYSMKLFKMIQEGQELEGWVQAKVTKAADYIASVYHFMEYEMKASEYGETLENSDVYSESVRRAFQQKLMEAKKKAEEVKKRAAKEDEKVEEGFPTVADAKARHEKEKGTGKFDKKQISTGTVYTRKADRDIEQDDDDDDTKSKSKSKKVKEGAKPDYLDFDKDGNKKEPMKKALKDKKVKEAQVNELSPDTLTSYADKAKGQRGWAWGRAEAGRQGNKSADPEEKFDRLHQKRAAGYDKAVSKGARDLDKSGQKSSWDYDKDKTPAALKRDKGMAEVAMSPAPTPQKSGIPNTATTTVPGMKATQQDLKKANSSAALGEGKCNHSPKGKKCPVHGLKECGSMYEAKNLKQQAAIAIAKKKAK